MNNHKIKKVFMHIINKILILGSWLVVLLLVHTSCTNSVEHSERTLNLLPEPAQLTVGKEAFILQDDMIISINAPSLKSAADYLVTILRSDCHCRGQRRSDL